MSLVIPLRDGDQVVEVEKDSLPDNATDIIDVLKAEVADINLWKQFALEYFNQGKTQQFEEILHEASIFCIDEKYADQLNERVQLLNTLAGYYIGKAQKEGAKDVQKRNENHEKASQLIDMADQADHFNSTIYVGRGFIFLNQGQLDRADTMFDSALTSNASNIAAMLGKACILFNRKKYADALEQYKTALRNNPACPASVRLGIGLCQYKLGNLEKARLAFDRVLEMESNNVGALVALAVMDLNSKDPTKIRKAITYYLRNAIQTDPKNSMALNHLANHFFFRNDPQKVQSLAHDAYNNSSVNEIKAESCYYRARVFHEQKNYENAFKFYYQIYVQLWPNFDLARFGLGQMYIQQEKIHEAIPHFEQVLKYNPDNYETLKILGSLYGELKNNDKALKYLQKAHEIMPNDEEILIEMAQLEQYDFKRALEGMKKAQSILENKGEDIPHEFWNNIGSLYHKLNQYEDAENYYMKSLQMQSGSLDQFGSEHLTVVYNLARLFEDSKQNEKARKLYLDIIKQHPSYLDCYFRLAVMEYESGSIELAEKWCNLASQLSPKDPTPIALVGYMYLMKEEWSKAQQKFEIVISNCDKDHLFTLIAMGCMYFSSIRPGEMKQEKIERYTQYACNFFEKALKKDKKNIFAALSLGAIIAEKGYINEAKDIFLKVREISTEIPEAWVNIAHISLCQKQYTHAATTYENCQKKFYGNQNLRLMQCLAKTYYEEQKYEECIETLQKALSIKPEKSVLHYDMGITLHDYAVHLMKEKKKTLEISQKATSLIEKAKEHFDFVAKRKSKDPILASKSEQFLEHIMKSTLQKLEQYRQQAELETKRAEEMRELQIKAIEDAQRKLKEEQMEKERLEKEKLEKERKTAQELQRKINEMLMESMLTPRTETKAKKEKGSRKKKDKFIDEEEEEEEYKDGMEMEHDVTDHRPKQRPQKPRKKKVKDANTTSSAAGDISDEEDSSKGKKKSKKKTGKKLKRKIKHEEDEDEEEEYTEGADYDATSTSVHVDPDGEEEVHFDDDNPKDDHHDNTGHDDPLKKEENDDLKKRSREEESSHNETKEDLEPSQKKQRQTSDRHLDE